MTYISHGYFSLSLKTRINEATGIKSTDNKEILGRSRFEIKKSRTSTNGTRLKLSYKSKSFHIGGFFEG